jgi:putative heme-binding domain-containing protein
VKEQALKTFPRWRLICALALLALTPAAALAQTRARPRPAKAVDEAHELATHPSALKLPKGFRAELLYSAPPEQGSWVSMTIDDKGRLITCDQYGGLYRIAPPPVGHVLRPQEIESLRFESAEGEAEPLAIGGVQGMVQVGYHLYAVVNSRLGQGPGLYRVSDTDADDRFDEVTLLTKLPTTRQGVEHGPHGIVLGPDGKSLYVVAGNMTSLPEGLVDPSPAKNAGEDQLLKRGPSSTGHGSGLMAPAGWICRTDLKGERWELVAAGFRNPYDLAFNRDRELFTYDADMEFDTGTPWYRPTRVCHVVSGGEFGWRFGTGKWPAYFPDSLPAVANVGLGSPTGIAFGYGARFPERYQNALFVNDWTYGKMYAVHLKPRGASYEGELEEFISGTPLPLTDLVISPVDKAMYFTIGGRRTQSGLYRVTYVGRVGDRPDEFDQASRQARNVRTDLESLHTPAAPDAVGAAIDAAWKHLGSEDRHLRFAARVAVEHQPTDAWADRALAVQDPESALTALLALARSGDEHRRAAVLAALGKLSWDALDIRQRRDLMRVYALALMRLGPATDDQRAALRERFASRFPADDIMLNHELCRLLAYLDEPSVTAKALELMSQARTQEDALFYAAALRTASRGWTQPLRKRYFTWFNEAEAKAAVGDYLGGGHLQSFLRQFRTDAAATLSDAEREQLKDLLEPGVEKLPFARSPTPRKFVRNWTQDELRPALDRIEEGRSFNAGKRLFVEGSCQACHRFANVGGIFGPDLTGAAKRYSRPFMLREIMNPSHVISDQHQTHSILTSAGRVHQGRILSEADGVLTVATDPREPAHLVVIPADEVEERKPSEASLMPADLLNTFTQRDVLDLLAYIESAGDPKAPVYAQGMRPDDPTPQKPSRPGKKPQLPKPKPQIKVGHEERPPNVVFIISDDQAWTDYGFMGHEAIETPSLDKLAAQSATFTRGYVPTALCRPSLTTIISGLYAHQHKITGNDPAAPRGAGRGSAAYQALRNKLIAHIDRAPSLPRNLGQHGYRSFQTGKWWEGAPARAGFTAGMTHGDPQRGGRHGDLGLAIGRKGMEPIARFLDESGDEPFFLWYAPFLPHTPHNPPERLVKKHQTEGRPLELAKYYAMCEWFDETCGELLDMLDEKKLSDNTLVIYVTDNGWIQRTSETELPPGWNQGFAPRSKQTVYEGGIRTPIMIRWPGRIEPRLDKSTLVSSIDLAPTVLAACGLKPTEPMQGVNLLPVCNGQPLARKAIFGESFAHDVADIDRPAESLLYRWTIADRWKLILTEDGKVGRYAAIHPRQDRRPQLYDILADPHEKQNVAAANPEIVKRLTDNLNQWWSPEKK